MVWLTRLRNCVSTEIAELTEQHYLIQKHLFYVRIVNGNVCVCAGA
jgi:hypothetical protein